MNNTDKLLVRIVFFCFALFIMIAVAKADLESLKDYPHPIICKPFVEKNGIVSIGAQSTWVIVTWASLEDITEDTLIFRNKDGVFYIPAKGYSCSQ